MPTLVKAVGSEHGVREGKFREWSVSNVSMGVVDIVFGDTENYPSGGIDVLSLISSQFADVQEVLGVTVLGHDIDGWVVMYDHTSGRLRIYGQEPGSVATGVVALTEMDAGNTATQGRRIRVMFFGV